MKITARIVQHVQGSPAWHEHRATHLNASELAMVMGLSPYRTRTDLIRSRATGIEPEIDARTAQRFQQGHEYEAIAREWAEDMLDDALYPSVLAADVDGLPLSASLDGQTLDGSIIFEHKSGRADLLASLEAGVIPEHYHPQLEQGLMLSGAERCLFMASSGDREAMRHAWYVSNPALRASIVPTWRQFLEDVRSYSPTPAAEPVRAEAMDSLPAVSVRLDGALTVAGNLPLFATALKAFIERMPVKPETDTDFATCEAACKALKKAEEALDAAEAGALASITDVEAMRRAVADCRKLARDTRLASEKLVVNRKDAIKAEIITKARAAFLDHVAELAAEIKGAALQSTIPNFAEAAKGKRTVATMQDAVDTMLAQAKIEANRAAKVLRDGLACIAEAGAWYEFLFADRGALASKPVEDLKLIVQARIDKHKAAEEAKEAARMAEAERIAREKIAAEQRAEAERQAAAQATAAAIAQAAAPAPAVAVAPAPALVALAPTLMAGVNIDAVHRRPAPAAALPPINLGTIADRLGFTLTRAFIESCLGIAPSHTVKASVFWSGEDFDRICAALVNHVNERAAAL